ncbi:GIY-YIG nuclease family protein [Flavobacterium sp.]|uniref:GIY-YIG nuclease family protein n=1 Tax=Flavobacterium sp. TaxID=239 RepID=UPI0022C41E81|nr:GIY-YIG nuclease family protein [Flavobacterium sp.]MCZ8298489.1 GIY-YIG nuclease family protein [Flavobacterium sp.]
MKYYVYVLQSLSRHYMYVGLTSNLEQRFSTHQAGRNRTTAPYRPFQLYYVERFSSRIEARYREKYLKSGSRKEFLKGLSLEDLESS